MTTEPRPFARRVTLARRTALSLAISSALLAPGVTRAQNADPARAPSTPAPALAGPARGPSPEEGAKSRARALYAEGAQAYDEGRYHRAADAFLDANRVYPTPQLCFNVAKAYDKLGHEAGALRYYREYLRRASNAPDIEETTARIRELEQALAQRGIQQLSVRSLPDGATVLLDGQPVGVTPWTGETWPGRHRVALSLPGYAPAEGLIELDAHRAADTHITLAPTRPAARVTQAHPALPSDASPRVGVVTWTALGVGTAALGTALALEMTHGENHGISRTGAFFTGAGAAATALGGALLYLDLNRSRAVAVGAALRSAHVTLSGRF